MIFLAYMCERRSCNSLIGKHRRIYVYYVLQDLTISSALNYLIGNESDICYRILLHNGSSCNLCSQHFARTLKCIVRGRFAQAYDLRE